ncbi:MAG: arsenosugar biosynthesis radical SAM protein ArsS [Candidatus Latescibacterota bacterium]|jgi:radical SAM/Cys-rich protein
MNEFDSKIIQSTGKPLQAERISIVQVNVGLRCNQKCVHCHVAASPKRREEMSWETMEAVLRVARGIECEQLDITGGAPEINPHFRRFVREARDAELSVQVRTNLTIHLEPGYEDLGAFLAKRKVKLVASLPCYLEENVDRQRGEGVYRGSVEAIRKLNGLGFGREDALALDLVYNPVGPQLPPDQESLEADYRRELRARHGIEFTRLITITNMPIGRFMGELKSRNRAESYKQLLRESFNASTVDGLMCRHQINVDWEGNMYDCDFNLALRLKVNHGMPAHIEDFDPRLHRRIIETGVHCFGCTAGRGSSCGGALV